MLWAVTETIRHGDYRNRRTVTVDATPDGVVSVLATSPYRGGAVPPVDSSRVQRIAAELAATGTSSNGWCDYAATPAETAPRFAVSWFTDTAEGVIYTGTLDAARAVASSLPPGAVSNAEGLMA